MKFADLHVHTHFSDGTYSPSRVVQEALKAELSCIAITDHDNTDGIDTAVAAAQGTLEVLAGIEMTAEYEGCEIHVLGYLLDYKEASFLSMLKDMQKIRVRRIHEICAKLKKLGVPVEPGEVFGLSDKGSMGRLHVARALFERGHVFSIQDAFHRYIGDKGPAYVGKFKMTPKEAIRWLLKVRGVPVLAHPYLLPDKALIADFVKDGLMGLEVYYGEHSKQQTQEFIKIAQKYDLLITGGSDCHGTAKEAARLGKVRLPYAYVEKIKEARCKIKP